MGLSKPGLPPQELEISRCFPCLAGCGKRLEFVIPVPPLRDGYDGKKTFSASSQRNSKTRILFCPAPPQLSKDVRVSLVKPPLAVSISARYSNKSKPEEVHFGQYPFLTRGFHSAFRADSCD